MSDSDTIETATIYAATRDEAEEILYRERPDVDVVLEIKEASAVTPHSRPQSELGRAFPWP